MTAADSSACLKVAMENFANAVHISKTQGNYQFSGPVVTLLDIIQNHLGICFQLMIAKYRVYGNRQPNGSWTGLIGVLQRQEVDFAGTLFEVTPERLASLDFSEPLHITDYNTLYPLPGVTPDMASFIKPYSPLVWLLVLFTTLMVFGISQAVLRGIECLRPNLLISGNLFVSASNGLQMIALEEQKEAIAIGPQMTGDLIMSDKESAMWIWGILLSQSVPWMPSKSLARCVAAVWLLMSFALGSVYRSNLKAMIIYPRIHLPFSTLEELADSNILTIIGNTSAIHTHIMGADKSSSLGRLKDQLLLYNYDQLHLAIQDIFDGKGAGISFTVGLLAVIDQLFSMTGKCSLYKMPRGFLGPVSLCLAFPKDSPFRWSIDQVIIRLRETGILAKLFSDGLVNGTKCSSPMGLFLAAAKERPFHLKDFYGVFLVYAAGLLLATNLFLGELIRGERWSSREATSVHGATETNHYADEL